MKRDRVEDEIDRERERERENGSLEISRNETQCAGVCEPGGGEGRFSGR